MGDNDVVLTTADYPDVLAARYASDELVRIWSPANKVVLERRLWVALLRAQRDLGVDIPDGVVEAYEKVVDDVDLDSIRRREAVTRHDVKARIEEFSSLAGTTLEWSPDAAVTVVMAAGGYPGAPQTGQSIDGLIAAESIPGVQVLHAGTRLGLGRVLTDGGRVLSVTAAGPDLPAARTLAYDALSRISFPGAQWRTDIAAKAAAGEIPTP